MDDTGPDGSSNQQDPQEQLAAARARIEQLEREAAAASARAESLSAELAEAQRHSAAEAQSLRDRLDEAEARERAAAAKYRDLLVRAEPSLPADLIAGDTIDDLDDSAAAARDTVARVRSHIESQAHAARVPAGAPERRPPDLSAMSPEQKIRYGLAQTRAT